MYKNRFLVALAVVATLFASYSCEDKDVFVFPEPSDSELTLLSVMQKDPDFANFLEVVDKCGEGCLDSLFNQSRTYTLWAPVNEAVDKEALIARIEAGDRDIVFQEFVKYHISNFLHPANGTLDEDNNLMMLNNKYALFTGNKTDGYTFAGQELCETNIRTKNGIVHKLSAPAKYVPSIWEAIRSSQAVRSFWDFCNSFKKREIDHYNSIPGPVINQQQTYLDTLYTESNEMLNMGNLGPVANEDSTYIVYVPTSEVWDEIVAEAPNYFNFNTTSYTDEQKKEADSLKQVRGAKAYLRYLTYSMTEQDFEGDVIDYDNLPDSLIAMYRSTPRKKVPVSKLTPIEVIKASNGELRIIDNMPFKPTELWHDTIWLEAENINNVRKDRFDVYVQKGAFSNVSVNEKDQNEDYEGEISGSYLLARPSGNGKTLPSRTYYIRNILSAKYKIAIIAVPEDILTAGDGVTSKNKSALHVSVSQSGEVLAQFPGDDKILSKSGTNVYYSEAIQPEKAAIDTIFLCDSETGEPYIFDFKHCEKYDGFTTKTFEPTDYTVELTISTIMLGRKVGPIIMPRTDVDNNFRIDAVLVIPVDEDEENVETETEQ